MLFATGLTKNGLLEQENDQFEILKIQRKMRISSSVFLFEIVESATIHILNLRKTLQNLQDFRKNIHFQIDRSPVLINRFL